MASFNPFSKAKAKQEEVKAVTENIEGEEVEFLPNDSVVYFEEAFQEKQAKESELISAVREKQRGLESIGANLESEKQKRQAKKAEIENKLAGLKQKQREIAQNLALENGDSKKLEAQLHEISVEIVSEQAKVAVYEDEVKFYLPLNIKQDLKNRISEYDQAIRNYQSEKHAADLVEEIRAIIKSLSDLEGEILQSKHNIVRVEQTEKLIKPYIGYFISPEDTEHIFGKGNQDLVENYFKHWINDDSSKDFTQYARYLMSL